jgi:antitoxin PrlF
MATSIISSKGQVVIPVEVRSDMQVEQGSRVEFVKTPEGWLLKPATKSVTILKGIIGKPKKPVSIEDMNRAIARYHKKLT